MDEPPLDDFCKKIFSLLTAASGSIRFNELHRALNRLNVKISKPTLSEHLKHLTDQGIFIRKEEGKQNVSYTINYDRFKSLNNLSETEKNYVDYLKKNEEILESQTIGDQVTSMHMLAIMQELYLLKLDLLNFSEPENKLENSLQYLTTDRYFDYYRKRFLKSCEENKQKCDQALDEIEKLVDLYIETVFEPKK